mgnify:CR=1 FL=1
MYKRQGQIDGENAREFIQTHYHDELEEVQVEMKKGLEMRREK